MATERDLFVCRIMVNITAIRQRMHYSPISRQELTEYRIQRCESSGGIDPGGGCLVQGGSEASFCSSCGSGELFRTAVFDVFAGGEGQVGMCCSLSCPCSQPTGLHFGSVDKRSGDEDHKQHWRVLKSTESGRIHGTSLFPYA